MSRTIYLNGDYLPEAKAKVSVFDRGYLFGDGIYEVVPVIDGMVLDISRVGVTAVFAGRDLRPWLDEEDHFNLESLDAVLGLKRDDGETLVVRCGCRPANHSKRADGDYRVGLEFVEYVDDAEQVIGDFVAQSLRYEDPPD